MKNRCVSCIKKIECNIWGESVDNLKHKVYMKGKGYIFDFMGNIVGCEPNFEGDLRETIKEAIK